MRMSAFGFYPVATAPGTDLMTLVLKFPDVAPDGFA